MKIAALILGILGSLSTLYLGAKWVGDYGTHQAKLESLEVFAGQLGSEKVSGVLSEGMNKLKNLRLVGYWMIAFGALSLAASFLLWKFGKIAGLIMLAAPIVPALFMPKTLIFTFFLFIAGGLTLLSARSQRPKVLPG